MYSCIVTYTMIIIIAFTVVVLRGEQYQCYPQVQIRLRPVTKRLNTFSDWDGDTSLWQHQVTL